MATDADNILELDDELEIKEPEGDDDQPEGDDGEEIPSFGDEDDTKPPAETDLIKHLRRENRELHKRIAAKPAPHDPPIEVGPRPTIEACEFDQDRLDAALDEWDAKREAKRAQDAKAEQQQRQQNESWQQVQNAYATKKAALPYADKEQVEATAFEALTPVQQAVIAKVAPDPALLIYAIGKNQAKLDQLASIDDPLVLAATIGRMGATLTMKKRAAPPEPDTPVRGGTVKSGAIQKQLASLEAKAAKNGGDRTEIAKFKAANKLL